MGAYVRIVARWLDQAELFGRRSLNIYYAGDRGFHSHTGKGVGKTRHREARQENDHGRITRV